MKLFNCFSASGYHSSIITTFGIDFDAYEAIALPRLRDAGCNNNIVVADARMLVQALGDGAHRPKFAGRRYSVVGTQCAGVFHPKLILQLGKASGRLLVTSANMTTAGMAGNFEVAGEVAVAEDAMEAAPLLRAAVDYLLRFLAPASVARRQVEWTLKRARWLPASASPEAVVALQDGMRVAFLARNDGKGIAERFLEFVGDRVVTRLVVVSPYWDHDLRSLRGLCDRFGAAKGAAFIQPQSALFPVHAHASAGPLALFDLNRVPGTASRFAHAKLFIAEGDSGDCVLFGSANCTEAALGTSGQAGINEEACLARDLPAGDAVRLLGLEEALSAGAELAVSSVPSFSPADDIPLSDLAARLPGRFELAGELLRWWPPSGLLSDEAAIRLLDQRGAPVAGSLSRLGTQGSPANYRFDGTVAPHFAQVHQGQFVSSLAVVVVEQSIHESQRRAAGRGLANVLDLLDDDEASEGLWLLEVIQKITEAEHEMRGPRGAAEQPPQQRPTTDAAPDSRVLSYDEFVAGRRAEDGRTASAGSHLAATHQESVRSFLNALIGKRAVLEFSESQEDEGPVPDLGLGDETADGAGAMESGDLPQSAPDGTGADQTAEAKRQLRQRQRYVQDTQRSIIDAVEAFLRGLREQANGQSLGVVDLLRLRALLIVVLGAGSKKTDLLPRDLATQVRRRQVLPSVGEASWRRLVGRLLYDFFRDRLGTRAPLIQSLRLESDGDMGLPEDVLECWATCFWATCAMREAVNDVGAPFHVTKSENMLAADLYRFTRLLPEQALGAVVHEVFSGMSRRYGDRLGVSAERVDQAHLALVEPARIQSYAAR
ncbi:phospholipase D family protein [Accumulibacter sp.]|uniref:PLD phosphodiesterase domain-containing protein n=1 Tax=Accumulibacter regalis TaxID=522306 RepID=C7RJI4_ACCRE|nr:phospholipase D family protein [Accumulibacter sp.]MBN8499188.1 phospholipase D family protein [Accumulibacter sp.]MBO3713568.1 phospholipase D family protein [Accumulibacter sp.]